jgi:hypothetical protein
MKTRVIGLVGVIALLAITASSVSSAPTAAIPDPGTSNANIFLQNLSQTSENATIHLEYTRQSGSTASPASFSEDIASLAPGAAKYLLYTRGWQDPQTTTVDDGWAGAVVVSSNQPVAAIVNLFFEGTSSAGTYPGVSTVANDVYLPNLLVRDGRLTRVSVQNAENSQCTDVTLNYFNRDGTQVMTSTKTIPANSQITLDLSVENPDFSATSGTGSLLIHSDTCNLAAVANIHYPAGNRGTACYAGFTSGEPTIYFPSIFRRQSGSTWQLYNATIVQNLGDIEADVTISFLGAGSNPTASVTDTIPSKASYGINMITQATASTEVWDTIQSLGTYWKGTIKVESTNGQDLAGASLYFSMNNVPDVMAFESIGESTASEKLYSPAVYRKYTGVAKDQWSATLVQNLDSSSVDIEVDFFRADGTHAAGPYTVTVTGNSSVGLNLHSGVALPQQALTDLGTGFSGGMVVTGPPGAQLIGVTNIFYESKVNPAVSRERGAAYPLFPAP